MHANHGVNIVYFLRHPDAFRIMYCALQFQDLVYSFCMQQKSVKIGRDRYL